MTLTHGHTRSTAARLVRALLLALGVAFTLAPLLGACSERRAQPSPAPVYRNDIARLLAARCASCHAGDGEAAKVPLDTYPSLLACSADAGGAADRSRPDAGGSEPGSALLAALGRADHKEVVTEAERARLIAWFAADAPLRADGIHAPGIMNPRSSDWHGRLAAVDRFAPLRDPARADACGRCHDGAPVRPREVRVAAPGAPACSQCHLEAAGVLACGTCHGEGARSAAPSRDRCSFDGPSADAHRAHLAPPRLGGAALDCTTCHPAADASLGGRHADGFIDIMFDRARAGVDARFDLDSRRCAVACHALGGARAEPRMHEAGPLGCGDCHGSPPADHFAGACDHCHLEPNADGSALRATSLHMNGRVDVLDGKAKCGACHGDGDDPLPDTPSHQLHRATTLCSEIACSECHTVPATIASAGHLDRGEVTAADVTFGPRARAFGQDPVHADGECRNIACHGAGVGEDIERALHWDERSAQTCSGCHGLPPGGDHPQDVSCATVICHGAQIRNGGPTPLLTASGRRLHIDGKVDVAQR